MPVDYAPRGIPQTPGKASRTASEVAGHLRIGHAPDVPRYLTDGLFPHGPGRADREEEKDMFTTDSFLGAEIAYRQDKVRHDYGVRRWTRVRATDTRK